MKGRRPRNSANLSKFHTAKQQKHLQSEFAMQSMWLSVILYVRAGLNAAKTLCRSLQEVKLHSVSMRSLLSCPLQSGGHASLQRDLDHGQHSTRGAFDLFEHRPARDAADSVLTERFGPHPSPGGAKLLPHTVTHIPAEPFGLY